MNIHKVNNVLKEMENALGEELKNDTQLVNAYEFLDEAVKDLEYLNERYLGGAYVSLEYATDEIPKGLQIVKQSVKDVSVMVRNLKALMKSIELYAKSNNVRL